MQKPDILRTTFDQQPQMSDVTQNMAVGDKIIFEVHATLKARDQEGVDWTVEAIVPEGYEIDKDAIEPATIGGLSASDAMLTPTAMMVRKSKNKVSTVGPNTPT